MREELADHAIKEHVPQLVAESQRLITLMEEQGKLISNLNERLVRSVARPEDHEKAVACAKSVSDLVPIASALLDISSQITRNNEALQDLLNRLEV